MQDAELRAFFEQSEARTERLENAVRAGFERTDARFDQMRTEFAELRTYVDARFAELRVYVDERFERVTELVAGHFEYALTEVNERLERLEQR
ncbi:MAG: hypothetical protein ACT4O1_00580 [Gemmatimonadota bacterium]